MAADCGLLLLRLCCWTAAIAAIAALRTGRDEGRLVISPPLNGDSGTKMVVKNGTKFTLSCIHDHPGHSSEQIEWRNERDKEIDGESSASVFTIGLRERHTHNYKRLLVFRAIDHRDAGRYRCVANDESGENDLSVDVDIVVVDACQWVDPEETVGAMEGERLRVDCSAEGKPEARISITDDDGGALPEDRYNVAGDEVTIDKVERDDQDTIVQCVASQVFEEHGYTNVETRKVSIDVWFAPEFADDEINRHGILDRNGSLICNVSDSNPPATDFDFFKDDEELKDSAKYRLEVNEEKQYAILHIKKVTDEDYGRYRCTVGNGKASSSQTINLNRAFPPEEVKVSLELARADSLLWKLEASSEDDEEDEQLPITELRVHYVRKELIDDATASNFQELADNREAVWANEGRVKHLKKSDDDLYEIEGLRPATEYVFRFQAVNEAGWGEVVEITAETEEVNPPPMDDGAITSSPATLTLVLLSMLLAVLLDPQRRL